MLPTVNLHTSRMDIQILLTCVCITQPYFIVVPRFAFMLCNISKAKWMVIKSQGVLIDYFMQPPKLFQLHGCSSCADKNVGYSSYHASHHIEFKAVRK